MTADRVVLEGRAAAGEGLLAAREFIREVEFPEIGTVEGFGGQAERQRGLLHVLQLRRAAERLPLRPGHGREPPGLAAGAEFRPEDYAVQQVFYTSKDGTRIPMFLAHKRGFQPSGDGPALLYGYGGFNISLPPRFSVGWLVWMEMGGLLAGPISAAAENMARPGTGPARNSRSRTCSTISSAAAQWLIDHQYTRPDKLAIQGGSNGGLLVGAVDDAAARFVRRRCRPWG